MRLHKLSIFLVIVFTIIIIGCKKEVKSNVAMLNFQNQKYNFSFSYPSGWEEVNRDLPEKWAILDKDKNTILFIVNKASGKDLRSLGMSQAVRDIYPSKKLAELTKDDLKNILQVFRLDSFNNRSWYTYGIKFSDKNVESLIAGTLCGENEVMVVLVSDYKSFDKNKETYKNILNMFKC